MTESLNNSSFRFLVSNHEISNGNTAMMKSVAEIMQTVAAVAKISPEDGESVASHVQRKSSHGKGQEDDLILSEELVDDLDNKNVLTIDTSGNHRIPIFGEIMSFTEAGTF